MSPLRELWSECLRHGTARYPGMGLHNELRRLIYALPAFLNNLETALAGNQIVQRQIQERTEYLRSLRDVPPPTKLEIRQ